MSAHGALLSALEAEGYGFVTITPASHARVARRWQGPGRGLRDLFGWSRAVEPDSVPASVRDAAEAAGVLSRRDGGIASRLRVSTVEGRLFLHSAFPTDTEDAVFLGPDSYRFAALIRRELERAPPPRRIVDLGAGAGVGGVIAAGCVEGAEVTLTDINAGALELARANAAHAGIAPCCLTGEGLAGAEGPFDLALLNPPFLIDEGGRAYRHGGGALGTALPLRLAVAAMERLAPGGRLILYSGSPIVAGVDPFGEALAAAAQARGCTLRYAELDPDVFGEELEREAYAGVDRIGLVAAVAVRA